MVCLNQVGDVQLAIAITRAYEGDDGPVLKEILEERVIPEAASDGNRWMASWAFWLLGRRDMAVRSLIVGFLFLLSFTFVHFSLISIPSSNLFHNLIHWQSSIETLIPSTPASPASAGTIPLHAKSYLSNDPALVVLYKQIREKTLQTLKGASKVSAQAEWNFIIRNARLYDRMGCDLLALDLVRHWEFLSGPPTIPHPPTKPSPILHHDANGIDYSKMLRRRSSLVVADMPIKPSFPQGLESEAVDTDEEPQKPKPKPPPTTFHEPDANSLLDSFGF